jgi:hypothetical protein
MLPNIFPKRRFAFSCLIVSFLISGSCTYLHEVLPIVIILPEPMINVKGERVNSILLTPGTAAILRYANPVDTLSIPASNLGFVRERKNVRLGGYFYGGWANDTLMSPAQLSWIAKTFDVLALNNYYPNFNKNNGGITPDGVDSLKTQNSRLKFYCMLFATTLCEPLFDPKTMSNWVVFDKNGKEALGVRRTSDQDPNHLMDLGNVDYANFFRNFIIDHTKKYHADGVATDEVMWNGYWGLDVSDMRDYSSVEQITQTCYDWLERVKSNNPKEVIHQAFWPEAQNYTNGIWGETSFFSWFRDDHEYDIFYETLNFNNIVETIKTYSQRGETYIWAAFYNQNDPVQLEYCVAAYLLGEDGNYAVFQPQPVYDGGYPNNLAGYDISTSIGEYERNKAIFDVELGAPIGEYYVTNIQLRNIWARKFVNGIVYCNPNED